MKKVKSMGGKMGKAHKGAGMTKKSGGFGAKMGKRKVGNGPEGPTTAFKSMFK